MPQIPAMIVAGLSAVGITTTTAAVSTWLVSQAVGIGMSILTMALTPKPRAEGGGITTQGTQAGADRPRKFILGRYASAGSLIAERYVYDIDKNDRKYLTQIIAVSDAKIDGYEYFILGDEEFTLNEQANSHSDDQLGRRPNSEQYGGATFFKLHNGNQTTADPMLVDLLGNYPERPINANFKMTGIAYMIFTAKYSHSDPKFSGIPQPIAIVRGKPLYDPRKDSTNGFGSGTHRWGNEATYEFSDNPIIMAYNILRGITLGPNQVWGAGASAEALPLSYWVAAANACDEAGSQTGTDWKKDIKRYRAGIEISVDEQPIEVVKELFKSCGASYGISSGQYLVSVGGPSAPVAHFTDDEIDYDSASEFIVTDGLDSRYNAISASYPSIPSMWKAEAAEEYKNDTWLAEDGGKYLPVSLDLNCVPWPQQVRRIMRETLKDSRRIRQHTIVLPNTYIGINPTDTITWTSATNGYNSKHFEVVSVIVNPLNLSVQVGLRERDPADYNFDAISDNVLPFVPSGKSVNPVITGVADFSVSPDFIADESGRARRSAIRLNWNTAVSYSRIAYQVRFASTAVTALTGTIGDTAGGMTKISDGILPNTAYQVRAKAIIPGYSKIEWSPWLNVTTGDYRLVADDIEQDVIDKIEESLEWINLNDQDIKDALDTIDGVQNEIANNHTYVTGLINTQRVDFNAEKTRVNNLVANTLNQAQGFTTTEINKESVARSTAQEAFAAELLEIKAALTSDELLKNKDFAARVVNDADYWTEAGTITVVAKNTGSTDTLIAGMPKDLAINMPVGANVSITQRIENPEYVDGDSIQYRFQAGALGTTARSIEVKVRWYNSSDVEILPAFTQTYTIQAGGLWRTVGDNTPLPADVAYFDISFRHASASGNRILFTDPTLNITNTALAAEVSEVKASLVNINSAFATYQTNVSSRFEATEGLITSEATTRSSEIGTLTIRAGALEASSNTNTIAIGNLQTGLVNANTAIAQQEEYIDAKFGVRELIRDGAFHKGFAKWNSGSLGTVVAKSESATGTITDGMPAAYALSIPVGSTYGEIRTGLLPVTAGEKLDWSLALRREANSVTPKISINFYNDNKAQITANYRHTITETGTWVTVSQVVEVPATSAYLRFYIVRSGGDTGTNPTLITNISLKRRQAFEQQTLAEIKRVDLAVANADNAFTSYVSSMNTEFNSLKGTVNSHSNTLTNVYTKSEADNAMSAAITTNNVGINNAIGLKANANTVQALITQVGVLEGNVSVQSTAITNLSANVSLVTTTANGKGKVLWSSTAPAAADRLTQNLWIDTTDNNNTPKRWNGTAWVVMSDKAATAALSGLASKADTSVTDALTQSINTANGVLTSHAGQLTNLNATVDKSTATGRFRITADANPTTAYTRIGLSAAANSTAGSSTAALFITAKNGVSEISMIANRTAFVASNANNAVKTAPLIIDGTGVRMTGAFIKNATISRGKIGEGAITGWIQAFGAKAVKSSKTADVTLATVTLNKPNKQPLQIAFSAAYTTGATIYLQRKIGTGAWTTLKTINDSGKSQLGGGNSGMFRFNVGLSGADHLVIDKTTVTGRISYRLMGRTYGSYSVNYGGGGSESSWDSITVRATGNFTNRYIGVFVAYK